MKAPLSLRVVGDLLTRLVGGDSWELAGFSGDDAVVTVASKRESVDVAALRAELRQQRIAGHSLPHVGPGLAAAERRAVVVVLGQFHDKVALLRIEFAPHLVSARRRESAALQMFVSQYGNAIAEALFADPATHAEHASRRAAPLSFIVDADGTVTSASEDADAGPEDLRAHLMPHGSEPPPVLRPVIADLLSRYRVGMRGSDLIGVLPFALVRLTPLRGPKGHDFLVSVEWLRSTASLENAAARYSISKRELQVLGAMLRGLAVSEIALELGISDSTVVFHLKRMLKKTSSRNRSELAARMLGWTISA